MTFLQRAQQAVLDIQNAFDCFSKTLLSVQPSRELPKDRLSSLIEHTEEGVAATVALLVSLDLISKCDLDIVDMETRLKGESGRLASTLSRMGDALRQQFFVKKAFESDLIELEERAQMVAAAIFPSAVQGLNLVNSKLWEFSRLQTVLFQRLFNKLVEDETLKKGTQQAVKNTFDNLESHFSDANLFLNQLAQRELTGEEVPTRKREVQSRLQQAKKEALTAKKNSIFSQFKAILGDTSKIAEQLISKLSALRVPVFPAYEDLEEMKLCMTPDLYGDLTGLQTFALLNIGSRIRDLRKQSVDLLTYNLTVRQVFPDRVYLDADDQLIEALKCSVFSPAPASLHRFRDGSYKQNTFAEGNLQISYERIGNGRINVDADIDLYRDPVDHLFGEVLINHLTGNKTDQYRIRRILDGQGVQPIGDFSVVGG